MSGATNEQLARLHRATPAEEIKQKPKFKKDPIGRPVQIGTLDYIDARYVQDVFDDAVGPENWQTRFELIPEPDGGAHMRGGIGVLVSRDTEAEWVWKYDVGEESEIEALKGSYSDAFKRAAVHWGVARDLYAARGASKATPNGRRTGRNRTSPEVATADESEVRSRPITDRQKRLLEARMREVGVTGDKRKALLLFGVDKHSSRDLTSADLDRLFVIMDDRAGHADIWASIDIVKGDG